MKLTESEIEAWALEQLEALDWGYLHGNELAPDSLYAERADFTEVILRARLEKAVRRLNPQLPDEAVLDAVRQVTAVGGPDLLASNEAFQKLLTHGVPVVEMRDGNERGHHARLIDFTNTSQNEYLAVNQFTIKRAPGVQGGFAHYRPDIILFVNGLPLVVLELKNPADENATAFSAYKQLQTYKSTIHPLFTTNALLVASDGLEARMGSLTAEWNRFMAWKSIDGVREDCKSAQLEVLMKGLLRPDVLLDVVRNFTVFEKTSHEDPQTGLVQVRTEKKVAGYHQYFAVLKALASTTTAAGMHGDKRGGVVWHTTGSGKSLSMVFFAAKLVEHLDNPTIVVLTDRNDLDDQLFDTFAACNQLLGQKPEQADSREHLKELLRVASGGIVFTTVQKFLPDEVLDEQGERTGLRKGSFDQLNERRNIVVLADEAHRTQYGLTARTVDHKDPKTKETIGKQTVYGFAKYMRDALPNATYVGFTGTPVEKEDRNTAAIFGDYVDVYDIAMAVADGATVPIYYESRLAKIELPEEGRQILKELEEELKREDVSESQRAKAKWARLEALVGHPERIKNVAKDIVWHFEQRQYLKGKAMVVAMSRRIAAELHKAIVALKPEWYDPDLKKGAIKVVMTSVSNDGPEIAKHNTSKDDRRALADRFKNADDPLQLVIVRDMWLTGFDVPCLHTLYIDKPMQGHSLIQAISRVNRVYQAKEGGLIVDYLGVAADMKNALAFYAEGGGHGQPAIPQEAAVKMVKEKLEVLDDMMEEKPAQHEGTVGAAWKTYYSMAADPPGLSIVSGPMVERYLRADTGGKLRIILEAEEHILGLHDGKRRFLKEVTILTKVFAIALPHDEALAVKDEVAFYQAVRARLVKFDAPTGGNGMSTDDIDLAIRQAVDQAIVSDKVIDIFDAAGIKKPDVSILSPEFLEEVRNMKHRNLAIELLRKILNDEIKVRMRMNAVQSKALLDMLDESIKKYQNNLLTAAQIIDELIKLAKDIQERDKRGARLKLSPEEEAFYDAVAANESAKEVLGDDTLIQLARVLVQRVRANATIDWTVKESVRAQLKVIVKRTLKQFGYPPDLQLLATETVLSQAELLAEFWNGK
ncbi:MAG: type I restriction endonuclease subunit R [Flavobacteriales bacterium]|nr:type I restriction endonuclease subunit R [Flavobacteriales bacterium]